MARYQVKPGRRFGASNEYGPGAILELPPEEAKSFLDKLQPLDVPGTPAAPAGLRNDLNIDIPAEDKLLPPEPWDGDQEIKVNLESDAPAKPKRGPKKA